MKSKIEFYRSKIVMPTDRGEEARYYSDLMYIKYKAPYCRLYFSGGAKYLVEISLACLLENLPEKPFFKCNRTEIINLCYYGGYKENPMMVVLEDGTEFLLSSRNIAKFRKKRANLKFISPPCPNCPNCNKQSCRDYWLFCKSPVSVTDGEE